VFLNRVRITSSCLEVFTEDDKGVKICSVEDERAEIIFVSRAGQRLLSVFFMKIVICQVVRSMVFCVLADQRDPGFK